LLRNGAQIVNTLSARGAGLEPVASRLHAEALLGGVELRPAGLSPAAILCVRRLFQAWPGALHFGLPSTQQREAFRAQVARSLGHAARSAARPAHEAVPASAEAVLFADRAELLSALARDFTRQCVAERWWWAALLSHQLDERAVFATWRAASHYVPAASAILAETRELVPFIARWPESELIMLVRSVAEGHGLPWLSAVLDEVVELTARPAPRLAARVRAPWPSFVAESEQVQLSPVAQLACGIPITLAQAGARAHSSAFHAAVANWARAARAARVGAVRGDSPHAAGEADLQAVEAPTTREVPAPDSAPKPFAGHGRHEATPSPARTDTHLDTFVAAPRSAARPDATAASHAALQRAAPWAAAAPAPLHVSEAERERPTLPNEPEPGAELAPAPALVTPDRVPNEAATPRLLGAAVSSELGGLFFLINLGLYLELYGDFSTPLTRGIPLPIWDFVAIVGAALLGEHDGGPVDPVWALLAQLAGRQPSAAPGENFDAPDALRSPALWLRPFPGPATCTFTRAGGRLRIEHPSGFTLLDVPAEADLHAQAAREAAPYGVRLERQTPAADDAESALSRWCRWLTRYARVRLVRALAWSADEVGRSLCRIPACIHVSATHVDIVMELADLPLEVRLAGLDRDPGWLPGAGRTLAFHFA
jgi:hypothetical protein